MSTRRQFPVKRYPANPITPHGAYYFLNGLKPNMTYLSYDGTIVFNLMGGMSIPDRVNAPESVRLRSLGGLIAPWAPIEQKGATQDGVTFVDALYDPIDGDMDIEIVGKTPQRAAQVIRDWIAAWDAKKPGELAFFDQHAGRWWANVRWTRNPVDKLMGGTFTRQKFTWPFKSSDAFWRSYDSVAEFRFGESDTVDDEFENLNAWDLRYLGTGDGLVYAGSERTGELGHVFGAGEWEAKWALGSNRKGRAVIARRRGFSTAGDSQSAYIKFGSHPSWSFADEASDHIWVRMGTSGEPGRNGVRLSIEPHSIELAYFVNDQKTVIRRIPISIPPHPGETWGLIPGVGDNDRAFKVVRGTYGLSEVMSVVEDGIGSLIGANYRGIGWGMESGTGTLIELAPADLRRFWGGDNVTATQTGLLRRINMGDQPMWDRYTLYGPGTFYIGSGPGSEEMVKFGPLERGQVVQLRADPRKRGVVDLTSVSPSPQQLTLWQQAMKDFISFAAGNNASPLEEEILSRFGIRPPQGNMYSLLDGRFSRPIPAKPAAGPVQPYYVRCEVEGGDADTRIVAAATPLRRWPM